MAIDFAQCGGKNGGCGDGRHSCVSPSIAHVRSSTKVNRRLMISTFADGIDVGISFSPTLNMTPAKDISFGGYFMDSSGKNIVGDDGLNGVELGPAEEVTRGWKPADRLASYSGGSGTDTLSFVYIVQEVSVSLFDFVLLQRREVVHVDVSFDMWGAEKRLHVGNAEQSWPRGLGVGRYCRDYPRPLVLLFYEAMNAGTLQVLSGAYATPLFSVPRVFQPSPDVNLTNVERQCEFWSTSARSLPPPRTCNRLAPFPCFPPLVVSTSVDAALLHSPTARE